MQIICYVLLLLNRFFLTCLFYSRGWEVCSLSLCQELYSNLLSDLQCKTRKESKGWWWWISFERSGNAQVLLKNLSRAGMVSLFWCILVALGVTDGLFNIHYYFGLFLSLHLSKLMMMDSLLSLKYRSDSLLCFHYGKSMQSPFIFCNTECLLFWKLFAVSFETVYYFGNKLGIIIVVGNLWVVSDELFICTRNHFF